MPKAFQVLSWDMNKNVQELTSYAESNPGPVHDHKGDHR